MSGLSVKNILWSTISLTNKRIASLYLGEVVDVWYCGWLAKFDTMNWEYFVEEFYHRFRGSSRKDFIEFNKLSQTSIVLHYQDQFEHRCSLMDAGNSMFSKKFFIFSFISGLKLELQPMIRVLKLRALNQVLEQALLQKQFVIEMCQSLYFSSKAAKFSEGFEPRNYDNHPELREGIRNLEEQWLLATSVETDISKYTIV